MKEVICFGTDHKRTNLRPDCRAEARKEGGGMNRLIAKGYKVLHTNWPREPEVLMGVCPSKETIVINDSAREDANVILYITKETVEGTGKTGMRRRMTK